MSSNKIISWFRRLREDWNRIITVARKKIISWFRRLREDWNRIITVARKPDRNFFSLNLKIILLVMTIVGILAYIIQLVFTLIGV